MGILEKINEIQKEMDRTQKNKATEYHLGTLKAKLAKLRSELIDQSKSSGGGGEGFDVLKSGDARVAMIGFPSVGKSSMLSELTQTKSEAASYEFTTLTCIPGVINYKDSKIQLLDLPGIIAGASKGKGRGRQVIGVARTADVVLMMLDASKAEQQKKQLQVELEEVGIRLNQRPPDISIRNKKTGGVSFNSTCDLTYMDEKLCRRIFQEYRIFNADVLFREDCTADQLIDMIEGNRVYMPCVYVCNKADTCYLDEIDSLAHLPHTIVTSIKLTWNIDLLLETIWKYLNIQRVFTKPRGKRPVFTEPLIMRAGSSVGDVCIGIHRDMVKRFKYALVWGTSAKHQPQRVGLSHVVEDEDVIQIMTK